MPRRKNPLCGLPPPSDDRREIKAKIVKASMRRNTQEIGRLRRALVLAVIEELRDAVR